MYGVRAVHQVKEHLAGLDRTRSELMRNIYDKDKNLKLEHTCYGLRKSLINLHVTKVYITCIAYLIRKYRT
jgi:hypothetical protein